MRLEVGIKRDGSNGQKWVIGLIYDEKVKAI